MKPASPPPPFAQRPSFRPTKLSSSSFVVSLFSQPYELPFTHPLCFDNHLSCRGVRGHRPSLLSANHQIGSDKLLLFSSLQPLWRSWISFSSSRSLFSATSSLFWQKQGVGIIPPSYHSPSGFDLSVQSFGQLRRHWKPSERANIPPQC